MKFVPWGYDATTATLIKETFAAHFDEGTIIELPREGMGAEDFAYFVQPETGVKGLYFVVGSTPEDEIGSQASHHSPFFKIELEPSIEASVEAMVVGAMTLMPAQ